MAAAARFLGQQSATGDPRGSGERVAQVQLAVAAGTAREPAAHPERAVGHLGGLQSQPTSHGDNG